MNFQKILLVLAISSVILFILSISNITNMKALRKPIRVTERFNQEQEQDTDDDTNNSKINLFKEVPDYLAKIVKERNNTFLIHDDNTRQDDMLDKLDDEIEKLSNLVTSLSVPIAENSVEKSPLKTDLSIEYDQNHFY